MDQKGYTIDESMTSEEYVNQTEALNSIYNSLVSYEYTDANSSLLKQQLRCLANEGEPLLNNYKWPSFDSYGCLKDMCRLSSLCISLAKFMPKQEEFIGAFVEIANKRRFEQKAYNRDYIRHMLERAKKLDFNSNSTDETWALLEEANKLVKILSDIQFYSGGVSDSSIHTSVNQLILTNALDNVRNVKLQATKYLAEHVDYE